MDRAEEIKRLLTGQSSDQNIQGAPLEAPAGRSPICGCGSGLDSGTSYEFQELRTIQDTYTNGTNDSKTEVQEANTLNNEEKLFNRNVKTKRGALSWLFKRPAPHLTDKDIEEPNQRSDDEACKIA